MLAERVTYVGSPEHKSYPSFAGPPMLRADASKCDPLLADRETLSGWLQKAVKEGMIGGQWEGAFPRYVWVLDDGTCYEGRLVNQELGQYKGYPLERHEWPEGVR